MLYEDSLFCQELQKSLLEGAPCSFTLDGRVMNPAFSVLERAARWDVRSCITTSPKPPVWVESTAVGTEAH